MKVALYKGKALNSEHSKRSFVSVNIRLHTSVGRNGVQDDISNAVNASYPKSIQCTFLGPCVIIGLHTQFLLCEILAGLDGVGGNPMDSRAKCAGRGYSVYILQSHFHMQVTL